LPETSPTLLGLEAIVAGYGKRQVVKNVSLRVAPGEIVALIGHNGAGKSTLLKAAFGLIPITSGRITLDGEPTSSPRPEKLVLKGVSYVPQGNRVFTDLTVQENLEVAGTSLRSKYALNRGIEHVFMIFPALKRHANRRAGTLSSGEKQMLALGNGLVTSPRLLLLDEPSLGIAPQLISTVMAQMATMCRESGVAVLIVEQKVKEVIKVAQCVYVMRNGVLSFSGPAAELDNSKLRDVYL